MKELLKWLCECYGPSGNEGGVRDLIRAEIEGHVDSVRVDPLGNLIATKGAGAETVMLAAHMDEIGVIASYVDAKGFVRFAPVGGFMPYLLLGQRLVFENGLVGTVGREKFDSPSELPKFEKMYLDVGAQSRSEASKLLRLGDMAVYQSSFLQAGTRYMGKAMDNRAACTVLIEVIRSLDATPHRVEFVFTVQEEVGPRGARTAAYSVEPDIAIALDVTLTGDTPESPTMEVRLGAGPAVKVMDSGMVANPRVKKLLVTTAEQASIPYQLEVLERGSTDGMAIQVSRAGVCTGVLSIPCRYVHTATEVVDERDLELTVKLLRTVLENEIPPR